MRDLCRGFEGTNRQTMMLFRPYKEQKAKNLLAAWEGFLFPEVTLPPPRLQRASDDPKERGGKLNHN